MTLRQNTIPVHRLQETTDQGFQLEKVHWEGEIEKAMALGSHRDDHYLFFVQLSGMSKGMVDFETFILRENTAFYIVGVFVGDVRGCLFQSAVYRKRKGLADVDPAADRTGGQAAVALQQAA